MKKIKCIPELDILRLGLASYMQDSITTTHFRANLLADVERGTNFLHFLLGSKWPVVKHY